MQLTKEQIEVVNDRTPFLAVSAGAGSGKTRVLVEKIQNVIKGHEARLENILAITFTEKAAFELKERICSLIKDETSLAVANIGTFHSFCARLLREHAPSMGLDPEFTILEEDSSGILVRKAAKETLLKLLEANDARAKTVIRELDLKEALNCIDELIRYRWHALKIVIQETASSREDVLREAVFFCFHEALRHYDLSKSGNLDFADLEIKALELLGSNSEVRFRHQKQFRWIFVDEYQDINDTQAELIALLHNPKINNLTAVGDIKQSIYRFRGANVGEFKSAIERADRTIKLETNFRSTPSIIRFVSKALPEFDPLLPSREDSPSVALLQIDTEEGTNFEGLRKAEAERIAEIIPSLAGTTACLFSSLKSSGAYAAALGRKGINCVRLGGNGFFEQEDILDLINAMRVVSDKKDIIGLLGLAGSAHIALTIDELLILCRDGRNIPLYDKIAGHEKGGFLKRIEGDSVHLNTAELVRSIAGANANENTEKLYSMVREIEDREQITIKDILEHIKAIRDRSAPAPEFPEGDVSSVVLTTIHKAKGLEFDNVILCDTLRKKNNGQKRWVFIKGSNGGIAFKLTPEDNPEAEPRPTPYYETLSERDKKEAGEENARLLYVAMTRAKTRLIVPLHPNAKKDGEWHKLFLALSGKYDEPPFVLRPSAGGKTVCRERGVRSGFAPKPPPPARKIWTATALEAYDRCPREYFLQYELKVPSAALAARGENRLPASVRGDIVHKMIDLDSSSAISDPGTVLSRIALEMGILVPEAEERKMLSQFAMYKQSAYGNAPEAKHEVPFLFNVNGRLIKGKIDMLIPGWEIVDFKTGKFDHENAGKKYELQVYTYAIAASRAFSSSKGSVNLLFLGADRPLTAGFPVDKKKLEETEERILNIISKIENGRFEPANACATCPYRINDICALG